jgi:hypothetical protein
MELQAKNEFEQAADDIDLFIAQWQAGRDMLPGGSCPAGTTCQCSPMSTGGPCYC